MNKRHEQEQAAVADYAADRLLAEEIQADRWRTAQEIEAEVEQAMQELLDEHL